MVAEAVVAAAAQMQKQLEYWRTKELHEPGRQTLS